MMKPADEIPRSKCNLRIEFSAEEVKSRINVWINEALEKWQWMKADEYKLKSGCENTSGIETYTKIQVLQNSRNKDGVGILFEWNDDGKW